jgi:hypothetical protein
MLHPPNVPAGIAMMYQQVVANVLCHLTTFLPTIECMG